MKRLLIFLISSVCVLTVQAQLPKVTLKDINGKAVSTDTLSNGGQPFIIDFFATWCKPCNRELDAISEVYEEWQQETGVKFIAVSIDQAQNINKVKPLVDNHGWDYEVLLDPNGDLKRAFGIQVIPYVLVVDGQGDIVDHRAALSGADDRHRRVRSGGGMQGDRRGQLQERHQGYAEGYRRQGMDIRGLGLDRCGRVDTCISFADAFLQDRLRGSFRGSVFHPSGGRVA